VSVGAMSSRMKNLSQIKPLKMQISAEGLLSMSSPGPPGDVL